MKIQYDIPVLYEKRRSIFYEELLVEDNIIYFRALVGQCIVQLDATMKTFKEFGENSSKGIDILNHMKELFEVSVDSAKNILTAILDDLKNQRIENYGKYKTEYDVFSKDTLVNSTKTQFELIKLQTKFLSDMTGSIIDSLGVILTSDHIDEINEAFKSMSELFIGSAPVIGIAISYLIKIREYLNLREKKIKETNAHLKFYMEFIENCNKWCLIAEIFTMYVKSYPNVKEDFVDEAIKNVEERITSSYNTIFGNK